MNEVLQAVVIILVIVEALQIKQLQDENTLIKQTIVSLYEY